MSSHYLKMQLSLKGDVLLKIWQMLTLIGAVVFGFSAVLPLISIQFIVNFSISLIDIYGWIGRGPPVDEAMSMLSEAFSSIGVGLLLTVTLFPITVIVAFASLKIGAKLCLIAGFLGIACWLGAIFSVEQFKILVAQSGGPFGALIASFIQIGYGVYVGILGSVILLASYFVAAHERRGVAKPSLTHENRTTKTM